MSYFRISERAFIAGITRRLLPWIATLVTALPFYRRLSRWLDSLQILADADSGAEDETLDHARAKHLDMPYEGFIERRDELRAQARKLLKRKAA